MVEKGEIKSTLTLDASKFSDSLEKAIKGLGNFDDKIANSIKSSTKLDKSVADLSATAIKINEIFGKVEKSLGSFSTQMGGVSDLIQRISSGNRKISESSDQAEQSVKRLTSAMEAIKPSLQRVTEAQNAYAKAQAEATKIAKMSTDEQIALDKRRLDSAERTSAEMLANKRRVVSELATLEAKLKNEALSHRVAADGVESRLGAYGGKYIIGRHMDESARIEANAAAIRAQMDAEKANLAVLEKENEQLRESINLANKAGEAKTRADRAALSAKEALLAAEREHKTAVKERMALEREAARQEMDSARLMSQMWKASAEAFAAHEIFHGVKAAVGLSGDMQMAKQRVRAQGLSPAELDQFNQKAYDLARQEKYLSNLDAINARMTAIASIGTNDQRIIDGSLADATRTAFALKAMGYDHGKQTDLIRNLYGLAEARQVMNDPKKIRDTFDTAFRISRASDGKISLGDLETVYRNLGPLAVTMTDQGMINTAALMEQFKVSGHHNSGSGAGVASVGTILKMFSLYATGKTQSKNAVRELAAAGILNDANSKFDPNSGANMIMMDAARNAGFKNSEQLQQNPIAYMASIRSSILKMMTSAAHRKEYFGNTDINNGDAQNAAFEKFAAKAGWSNRAIQAFSIAMSKAFEERAAHVADRAKNGEGSNQATAEIMKTWKGSVDQLNASMSSIGTSFEGVLKPLSSIVSTMASFINMASRFAASHPLTAELNLAAIAAGALVLSFKAATGFFGTFINLGTVMKALAENTKTAEESSIALKNAMDRESIAAAGLASAEGTASKESMGFAAASDEAALASKRTAATLEGASLKTRLFSEATLATADMVSKGFLRMIPLVGELMIAWDLTSLIGSLNIGGRSIESWMDSLMDYMITSAKNGWKEIDKIFGTGATSLHHVVTRLPLIGEIMTLLEVSGKAGNAGSKAPWKFKEHSKDLYSDNFVGPKLPADYERAGSQYSPEVLGANPKRHFENLFLQSMARVSARKQLDLLRQQTLLTGTPTYEQQAIDQFKAHWLGGEFDPGHDPTKRMFMKKGATNVNSINSLDLSGKNQRAWIDSYMAILKLEDEYKGLAQSSQLLAKKHAELKLQSDLSAKGIDHMTASMRALVRDFAALEARNPNIVKNADYQKQKKAALNDQNSLDLIGFNKDAKDKIDAINAKAGKGQIEAAIARKVQTAQKTLDDYNSGFALMIGKAEAHLKTLKEGTQEWKDLNGQIVKAKANSAEIVKNLDKAVKDAGKTPLDKATASFKDFNSNVLHSEQVWSGTIMKFFTDATSLKFRNGTQLGHAFQSMLARMFFQAKDMFLKAAIADPIHNVTQGAGNALMGWFKGLSSHKADPVTQSVAHGASKALASSQNQLWTTIQNKALSVFDNVKTGFGSVWSMMKGAFGGIWQMLSGLFTSSAASSVAGAAGAASGGGFLASLTSMFADGGIMTNIGPVALRKYANGGVATSPQVALYGEGSSPEAYVPLPDGRTIPVTMRGGGGGVNINIVVNANGQASSNTTGGNSTDQQAWMGMADKIKQLVITQIVDQKRPGGVLYQGH